MRGGDAAPGSPCARCTRRSEPSAASSVCRAGQQRGPESTRRAGAVQPISRMSLARAASAELATALCRTSSFAVMEFQRGQITVDRYVARRDAATAAALSECDPITCSRLLRTLNAAVTLIAFWLLAPLTKLALCAGSSGLRTSRRTRRGCRTRTSRQPCAARSAAC